MEKGEDGVWSVTIGPIGPDVLSYTYKIDGVQVTDPHNPRVKLWQGGAASLVEVPAEGGTFYDVKNVPHGDLHVHWYQSDSLGKLRRVYVYTPPGYERQTGRSYPVLYLCHGSGDNESTWSQLGYANLILDNLIAGGGAEPMLVVMPNGHPVSWGERARGAGGDNREMFRQDLVEDLLPLIESRYRVKEGRENRAIAGLSMGGGQSMYVGLGRPDLFSQVGAFSSSIRGLVSDPKVAAFFDDAEKANSETALFWLAIGEKDFLLDSNRKFETFLKAKGIEHTFNWTEGDHSWPVWRRYLRDFAPLLFKSE